MQDHIRLSLLHALIGEHDGPTRWTLEQLIERSGLPGGTVRRGVEQLAHEDPPLAWFDRDARTGEWLAWLLPHGLGELDRLDPDADG